MLFYFLFSAVVPAGAVWVQSKEVRYVLKEELPDFELTQEGFWIEEPFYYKTKDTYIGLDSERRFSEEKIYQQAWRYKHIIMIDSEKLIVKDDGEIETMYFDMIASDYYLNKGLILAMFPMIYLIIFVMLLLYFVWITALFFLGVLLVSLPGLVLNAALKTNLRFGQIFVLALYGRTLPLMFKGVVVRMCDMLLFRVNIPFFWVLNFGATLIYMYLAMKKIEDQGYPAISCTYQQNPYQQNPNRQNLYQQTSYHQTPYQQSPYSQDYQKQNGYSGRQGSGDQDYGDH